MENLCALLFELSNEDRLRILHQLEREAMNVTNLSKRLNLTIQEVSRHVSRLGEIDVTQKDVGGLYHISPYGKVILKQLLGLKFTSQHRVYFDTHTLKHLPLEFVNRIGELADSTYTNHAMMVLSSIERLIQEAEKYIWWIADQYLVNHYHLEREAYERGVKVKCIEPKNWTPLPKTEEEVLPEDIEAFNRARTTGLVEERILEGLDVFLYVSDKKASVLAFPTLDGKFDYLGFSGTDERTHKWCGDLFRYYWEKAELRRKFIFE